MNRVYLCLFIILFANFVSAQNNPYSEKVPYFETKIRELKDKVLADNNSVSSNVTLLSLWNLRDKVTTESFNDILEEITYRIKGDIKSDVRVKNTVNFLNFWNALENGEKNRYEKLRDRMGFIQNWLLLGPFRNESGDGYRESFQPEKELNKTINISAVYQGINLRELQWMKLAGINSNGSIHVSQTIWPDSNMCGYGVSFVKINQSQDYIIWTGVAGAYKLWIDETEVMSDPVPRGLWPDRDGVKINLKQGWHRFEIKFCTEENGGGDFYLRLTDKNGGRVKFISSNNPLTSLSIKSKVTKWKLIDNPLIELKKLIDTEHNTDKIKNSFLLGEYTWYTISEDQNKREFEDLITAGAEEDKSLDALLLASKVSKHRNKKLYWLNRAKELYPSDPYVWYLLGDFYMDSPNILDSIEYINKSLQIDSSFFPSIMSLSDIYSDYNLSLKAFKTLTVQNDLLNIPEFLKHTLLASQKVQQKELEFEYLNKLINIAPYDYSTRQRIINTLHDIGEKSLMEYHLNEMEYYFSGNLSFYNFKTDLLINDSQYEAAEKNIEKALEISPQNPDVLEKLATIEWFLNKQDEGLSLARKSLQIRPTNQLLSNLINLITVTDNFARSYIIPVENLISDKTILNSSTQAHFIYLVDNTVIKVFENGLASRFVQTSALILDEQGARDWTNYAIRTSGDEHLQVYKAVIIHPDGTQEQAQDTYRFDVYDPSIRMYFDLVDNIILFPRLTPGDVIEIQYQIDDTNYRNYFADYFGDMKLFAGTEPKLNVQYVLITPKQRNFYYYFPSDAHIQFTISETENEKRYIWSAHNVEEIVPENYMPGISQVSPYVHVSTYRNWEEVGTWYWGLVKNQLIANDNIKATVREITSDAQTDEQKVRAIYNWVLNSTRYIALEFGIYGYKPYSTPEIVERGFGDCKDKASLLVVMLKEAGINAYMVILRMRDLGMVNTEPASLAIFNHAIVYIPSLDIWLDGTAEMFGYGDLPEPDQGAMALVINPDNPHITILPFLSPASNYKDENIILQIDEHGNAILEGDIIIKGTSAAIWRYDFQAESTRTKRLEESMSSNFPGVKVLESTFVNMDKRDEPLELKLKMVIPNYATKQSNSLLIPFYERMNLIRYATYSKRNYPLDLESKMEQNIKRVLKIPAGFKLGSLPDAQVIASEFGRLEIKGSKINNNEVLIEQHFILSEIEIPVKKYQDFRLFCNKVDNALNVKLIVEQ